MNYRVYRGGLTCILIISLFNCKLKTPSERVENNTQEFVVPIPDVSYPLPVVDNIINNCKVDKKRSIKDNPVVYLLRGINNIWRGTTVDYQDSACEFGPWKDDYLPGNPIVDSINWKENIRYCIEVTNNRTEDEAILAYLDDVRSKFYSVTDGFGPLTEAYVNFSGAYVDLPEIKVAQVLEDQHYQSVYNNNSIYAGDTASQFGSVVKFVLDFKNTCSSTSAPKSLFATPRPWRMNDVGEVNFLGTTYDTITHKPTYHGVNSLGQKSFKIFDKYECSVKVVPGLMCSRKDHRNIYDDGNPTDKDLYSNMTTNIRTDNGYPSGHTNAGALISLAYAYAFPERFSELVYRGAQLGEDRIVAGMHSPVDVMGGKIMALTIACAALNRPEVEKDGDTAIQTLNHYFGTKADSAGMSLYNYAHRVIDNPTGYIKGENINVEVFNNNIYDDKNALKRLYRERLTYGFTPDKDKVGQKPIVPKGAEVILKSRFPYLTDNQRRTVLYTTEIPSGYKLLDKTNGWGRIDLLTAADGYGSFIGNVHVKMDATVGGYSALDSWGNNIDGNGSLLKSGNGKLILSGINSYTGGTTVEEGTLVTVSDSALGTGDVLIKNKGILEVENQLSVSGNYKQTDGKLLIHVSLDSLVALNVSGKVLLENGSLEIKFGKHVKPKAGDKFAIIQADKIKGDFNRVSAEEYRVACEKLNNTVYLVIE